MNGDISDLLRVSIVLFFLLASQFSAGQLQNADPNIDKVKWKTEALQFLANIQSNCSTGQYISARIGVNGGFAAQIQLVGGEFMTALAGSNFQLPVVITGPLKGYSSGDECAAYDKEWTCFFEPVSSCQASGHAVPLARQVSIEDSVPPQFQHLGLAFWWGVVQLYMFRFRPFVYEHIAHEAHKELHGVHGFPYNLPMAGLHVRHGDKRLDGFLEHSLQEELSQVRKSPDCMIVNKMGDCFISVRFNTSTVLQRIVSEQGRLPHHGVHPYHDYGRTSHAADMDPLFVLQAAIHKRIQLLHRHDMDRFNHSDPTASLAVNAETLWKALQRASRDSNGKSSTSVTPGTSSSNTANKADRDWLHGDYVMPLPIFVASDDPQVLQVAQSRGYFVDTEGVSQHTSSTGMLSTLIKQQGIAYNATQEIITDIHFLSHCSTLVGTASSQVFRMAVALSNATDRLHYVQVLDLAQVGRVQHLSRKYHVPFPEHFE